MSDNPLPASESVIREWRLGTSTCQPGKLEQSELNPGPFSDAHLLRFVLFMVLVC